MIETITYSKDIALSAQKTMGRGILRELVQLIDEYNGKIIILRGRRVNDKKFLIPPHVVDLIDKMCLCCMAYLLARAPHARKESGQRKWNGVLEIQQRLVQHANFFGIRLLRGDFAGKTGDANYWIERHIPQKPAFSNEDMYTSGVLTRRGPENSELYGYQEWLDTKCNSSCDSFLTYASLSPSALQYFDDNTRQFIAVEIKAKKLKLMGAEAEDFFLDTPMMGASGTYSGLEGVCIYAACPRTLKIYTYPAKDNVVHHSSFLQGAPVMAAGDWLVEDGMVKFINAASGHYQPTVENMRLFATLFRDYWNSETLIQPEYDGYVYRIDDFIGRGAEGMVAPTRMIEALKVKLGDKFKHRTDSAQKGSLPSWPPVARK